MAEISVFGRFFPDASGDVTPSSIDAEITLTNPKLIDCVRMQFPTGSDIGGELLFTVPPDYTGSPVLVIKGILNGNPAATTLAFGAQQLSRGDSDPVDVAYEAEDLASNGTWTGYASGDFYEETITLTPASAYSPGDEVMLKFFRDDNVDTTTFDFLLTDLLFQYA